ncbi:MAG TPA: DNA-binding protein, partial [Porphyromonadaceae bacterium]|nr:DNA-binding protein [Porphyromonadaceae bacterium]
AGWIDGEARETARFNKPSGICYDEEEEIFYIADNQNKRIRTISVE